MNLDNRAKVINYLSKIDTSTLLFTTNDTIIKRPDYDFDDMKLEPKLTKSKIGELKSKQEEYFLKYSDGMSLSMDIKCFYGFIHMMKNGTKSVSASTRIIETTGNRNRSIIDIWRHMKFFFPDMEIFDAMHLAHDNMKKISEPIGAGKLFVVDTLVCDDINRRVFFIHPNNARPSEYIVSDEFGLKFTEWENI